MKGDKVVDVQEIFSDCFLFFLFAPLIESIHKLPDTVIDSLVSQIQALQNKYATTFFEVEQQISETEATLSGMIDDLEGNEYDMLGLNELKKLLGGSAE